LDTERIDDAAMKGQMQFLSLIGIHARRSAIPVTLALGWQGVRHQPISASNRW
jgi:hypothetical protein